MPVLAENAYPLGSQQIGRGWARLGALAVTGGGAQLRKAASLGLSATFLLVVVSA